jgi:hypothetical protein
VKSSATGHYGVEDETPWINELIDTYARLGLIASCVPWAMRRRSAGQLAEAYLNQEACRGDGPIPMFTLARGVARNVYTIGRDRRERVVTSDVDRWQVR